MTIDDQDLRRLVTNSLAVSLPVNRLDVAEFLVVRNQLVKDIKGVCSDAD